VLPEESTSAIASRLNSSVYRFVYLFPTWCYFPWNLRSQSPGVHHQGEASPLGIIPFTAQRIVWPLEAFYLHDDTVAVVETLTAESKVTQPRELAWWPMRAPRPMPISDLRCLFDRAPSSAC
ncbi:hypothetical protein AB0D31_34520, partial [Streptomyces sp. NPDC048361]